MNVAGQVPFPAVFGHFVPPEKAGLPAAVEDVTKTF
jgi:hypothetical protein